VFNCGVTNIYGAREVGHIAALCPAGGLHVNQENLLVESTTDSAHQGTPGELLVTTLDATPMPFIRYQMGDIAEVAPSDCSCGRQLHLLKNLLGRTGEIFQSKAGRMISPNFWCRVFMSGAHAGQIRRFQVIYTRERDLRIIIEKADTYTESTEQYLKTTIADNFSPDTSLEIEYVDRIAPSVSGKYQMVVNEAKL
jgi:phenylacetate-CoA ligase